jgi:hypothetical protein
MHLEPRRFRHITARQVSQNINHKNIKTRTAEDCIGPLASPLPSWTCDGGGRIGCARSLGGATKAAC